MRRGTALTVVLFALAMAAALAVGGSYVARAFSASAAISGRGLDVEGCAELALTAAVATWDSAARAVQPVGWVERLPGEGFPGVDVGVWITRIGPGTYWLVAEAASVAPPSARRRLGLLVRIADGAPVMAPERPWAELP